MAVQTQNYTVYRLYDAERTLLYVGITNNVRARFQHHANKQPWWPNVTHVETDEVGGRDEAVSREIELIASLHPQHNAVTKRRTPPGGAFDLAGA
jgi:excinuclease UvrABC nuclease subunit